MDKKKRWLYNLPSEDAATIALGLAAATNDSGYAGSYTLQPAVLQLVRNDGINFSVGDGQTLAERPYSASSAAVPLSTDGVAGESYRFWCCNR